MTTQEMISNTNTFKNANPVLKSHLLSPANTPIIADALAAKNAGFSFEEWSSGSICGPSYKSIVKELFN